MTPSQVADCFLRGWRRLGMRPLRVLASISLPFVLSGCDLLGPDLPPDDLTLDAPFDDLTPEQLAVHVAGDEEFGRRFSPEEGLGPIFIASSCDQCHVGEGKGHPVFDITRFGATAGGTFTPLRELGGPQLQSRAVAGFAAEVRPSRANVAARFTPPAITGLGFLEAVDDTTLIRLADPDDLDGDGISGRLQILEPSDLIAEVGTLETFFQGAPPARGTMVEGGFIGRFGKKGVTVNLLHQTVTAYVEDMGITSDLIPDDRLNVQVGNFASDGAPDPEVPSSTIQSVVFYLKTLRPPPRRKEDDPVVRAGEALFSEVGCASCHLPTLRTGVSEIPQLSEKAFHPFTDLLLHDMGPELDDGYTEGRATPSEWRTAPLWGLGLAARFQGGQAFLLHDGRARSIEEAIGFHGGEGARSRSAFEALSAEDRGRLLTYLRSL